jgi:hypothetical protein
MAATVRTLDIDASLVETRPLLVGRLAADDSYRKMARQPVRAIRRIGNWMKTLAVFSRVEVSTRHRHEPQASPAATIFAAHQGNWRVRHSVIVVGSHRADFFNR